MSEPTKQKSKLRLNVEVLEERIAPTVVGAGGPVDSVTVDTANHSVELNTGISDGEPPPEVTLDGEQVTP